MKRPLTPELIAETIDQAILNEVLNPALTREQAFKLACDQTGFPTMADMGFDPLTGTRRDS